MLAFLDFVPQAQTETKTQWNLHTVHRVESRSFTDAVVAANAWIQQYGIKVLQFETVVLPNVWAPGEEGSTDGSLAVQDTGDHNTRVSHWHQFLRVWYEHPGSP